MNDRPITIDLEFFELLLREFRTQSNTPIQIPPGQYTIVHHSDGKLELIRPPIKKEKKP